MEVSPAWQIKSLGISADDFINRDSDAAPQAFMGKMWRFAKDKDAAAAMSKSDDGTQTPTNPQGEQLRSLDNFLIDEAKRKGLPIPTSDTATLAEQRAASDSHAQAVANAQAGPTAYTQDVLDSMPKQELQDIAASLGVANPNVAKPKLIEAILQAQM